MGSIYVCISQSQYNDIPEAGLGKVLVIVTRIYSPIFKFPTTVMPVRETKPAIFFEPAGVPCKRVPILELSLTTPG